MGWILLLKTILFLNNQLQKLPFTCHIQPLQWLYAKESHSFSSPCSVSTWSKCCEIQIHSFPWHLNSRSLGREKSIQYPSVWLGALPRHLRPCACWNFQFWAVTLFFFVIFPISLRSSVRLNPLSFFLLIFFRAFLRLNQPFSTKLFLFLTLSNSRTEECSRSYAQIILISMVGSSMDRDQPGVCLCGIHSRIPILSFLEDPRLEFRLVLLFGRAAPGQAPSALGNPWDPSLEPKFPSLMPSSSFLGEPQLQGCSLPHVLGCLPRAGSYSSLEH